MLVDLVFQYRTLLGKCDLGCGLDWDEIEAFSGLEAAFAPYADDVRTSKGGRRFRREKTTVTAVMRGDQINDRVEIVELGLGGLVARNAPFIARGEHVELVIESGDSSYRFHAVGIWLEDDGDDYRVGLQLIGMPVRLRRAAISEHVADIVDKVAA